MESSGKSQSSLTPSTVTFSFHSGAHNCSKSEFLIETEYETSVDLTSRLWRPFWRFTTFAHVAPTEYEQNSNDCTLDRWPQSSGGCQRVEEQKQQTCRHVALIERRQVIFGCNHAHTDVFSAPLSAILAHCATELFNGDYIANPTDASPALPVPPNQTTNSALTNIPLARFQQQTSNRLGVQNKSRSQSTGPRVIVLGDLATKSQTSIVNQHGSSHSQWIPFQPSIWWILFSVLILCAGTRQQGDGDMSLNSEVITTRPTSVKGHKSDGHKQPEDPTIDGLLSKTPAYMFQLHERHKTDWLEFDQFGKGHVKHPFYRDAQSSEERGSGIGLGAVTAIRHHKHIGTYETYSGDSNPWLNAADGRSRTSNQTGEREHQLLFRLAEMPENELLIAASIRLRYLPKRQTGGTTVRCDTNDHVSHWPVIVWLHYENFEVTGAESTIQVFGSFEPDISSCEISWNRNNETLLHFPSGWFNIPLNEAVLNMLQRVGSVHPDSARIIAIGIRSISSSYHEPVKNRKHLRLSPDETATDDWLHDAPHLITYHRDQELVQHVKRNRRSVGENLVELSPSYKAHGYSDAELESQNKISNKNSFIRRYRKLQKVLQNQLQQTEQKRRTKRRVTNPRRHSRDNSNQWRRPDSIRGSVRRNDQGRRKLNRNMFTNDAVDDPYTQESNGQMDHGKLSMDSPHYLENICQRRELIIDFASVGWSGWVIAPRTYNARQCSGQCPFPLSAHYNTTNHAVLLQLVHLLDAAQVAGPCCVPHQLSPQSLLYHSQKGDVVLRVYQDMVVESCACR